MRKLILILLVGAYAALLSACAAPSLGPTQSAAPATPSVADGSGAVWDCNGGCRRIR